MLFLFSSITIVALLVSTDHVTYIVLNISHPWLYHLSTSYYTIACHLSHHNRDLLACVMRLASILDHCMSHVRCLIISHVRCHLFNALAAPCLDFPQCDLCLHVMFLVSISHCLVFHHCQVLHHVEPIDNPMCVKPPLGSYPFCNLAYMCQALISTHGLHLLHYGPCLPTLLIPSLQCKQPMLYAVVRPIVP